jgi:hypothetical protein
MSARYRAFLSTDYVIWNRDKSVQWGEGGERAYREAQ